MNTTIPENKKISPYFVFFLLHSMQSGVGILGFQRIIAKSAGYDAWISILVVGVMIMLLLSMMFKLLKMVDGDIVTIHSYVYGKKIGKFVSSLFIIYFFIVTVAILRNYIEIIQVWMFPELQTFLFAAVFLLVVLYIVFGGFRVVTGISFYSIMLPSYILILFLYAIPYSDFTNLLPVFDHSVADILKGSYDMGLSTQGLEILLFFYPFIKNPEKSKKWAYLSILYTIGIYLYLAIITFSYFPEEQLKKNIWPSLTMWKIIKMPFVERFEYIGIANWFLVILPNASIGIWCASRLAKQLFSVQQKSSAVVISVLCLVATSLLSTRGQIDYITSLVGKMGFFVIAIYIPILFVATLIVKKVKSHAENP